MAEVRPLVDLNLREYEHDVCHDALQGDAIPHALGLNVTRLCVIHGMRHRLGYGEQLRGLLPEFTRALNARRIMSAMPTRFNSPDDIPYCIWHPDVAPQGFYQRLVRHYPEIRYQVGRACAVAGYTRLFMELDLLPDVSIAEEARANTKSGQTIFNAIMAHGKLYRVMNDYDRTICLENPPEQLYLNGDTAIAPTLQNRQRLRRTQFNNEREKPRYDNYVFNITEDWSIDAYDLSVPLNTLSELLYSPLPFHLPQGDKDLLILHAAWTGNIDRYARLRRPVRGPRRLQTPVEYLCLVRGIYHSTAFGKWCSLQPSIMKDTSCARAVRARFIMSNDLSHIDVDTHEYDMPHMIWYPNMPCSSTLVALARRMPCMKPACARAAIIMDSQKLFDDINADPEKSQLDEARASKNPYYAEVLLKRAVEFGIDMTQPTWPAWKMVVSEAHEKESVSTTLYQDVDAGLVKRHEGHGPYEGQGVTMDHVERFIAAAGGAFPDARELVRFESVFRGYE